MQTMDVMIDLETMSTRPDAAIVQIGAVLFEARPGGRVLNGGPAFNKMVRIQDGAGAVDHSTISWWLQQPSGARLGRKMEEAEPLQTVLEEFSVWPTHHDTSWQHIRTVWAKGADFDIAILRSAFNRFGAEPPWHYRAVRCCRTLFDLAGGEPAIDWAGFVNHDAEDDAVGQAMQVQAALTALNISPAVG